MEADDSPTDTPGPIGGLGAAFSNEMVTQVRREGTGQPDGDGVPDLLRDLDLGSTPEEGVGELL